CNPTSSKFIHTWLRFGEIMRGSLRIKRIKPSIIYRLLLIGLGSPMVIYGLVRPLTIETRD
ncbi:hypothetical protein, partial [Escherichia coli]